MAELNLRVLVTEEENAGGVCRIPLSSSVLAGIDLVRDLMDVMIVEAKKSGVGVNPVLTVEYPVGMGVYDHKPILIDLLGADAAEELMCPDGIATDAILVFNNPPNVSPEALATFTKLTSVWIRMTADGLQWRAEPEGSEGADDILASSFISWTSYDLACQTPFSKGATYFVIEDDELLWAHTMGEPKDG